MTKDSDDNLALMDKGNESKTYMIGYKQAKHPKITKCRGYKLYQLSHTVTNVATGAS